MKLHFENDWLRRQIETDADICVEVGVSAPDNICERITRIMEDAERLGASEALTRAIVNLEDARTGISEHLLITKTK